MVRAAIVHVQRQDQRRTLRCRLGSLHSNIVKKITAERYASHFNKLVAYIKEVYQIWPTDGHSYDTIISEYLEMLWDTGEPKTAATYTLASVHFYLPQLKKQLNLSWKLKSIWERLELPCQAVPFTQDMLFGVMGWFYNNKQYEVACGCALAFNGLLRTGELLGLHVGDCHHTTEGWIITIRASKGGQRRLIQDETVIITDPLVSTLLVKLTRHREPGEFLLKTSPSSFRASWSKMRAALHLTEDRYIPYALRRGGATWYFLQTGSFSKTMLRGRWQHLKTCKLYISQAQLALANQSLPPLAKQKLHYFKNLLSPHLVKWASQGRAEGNRSWGLLK